MTDLKAMTVKEAAGLLAGRACALRLAKRAGLSLTKAAGAGAFFSDPRTQWGLGGAALGGLAGAASSYLGEDDGKEKHPWRNALTGALAGGAAGAGLRQAAGGIDALRGPSQDPDAKARDLALKALESGRATGRPYAGASGPPSALHRMVSSIPGAQSVADAWNGLPQRAKGGLKFVAGYQAGNKLNYLQNLARSAANPLSAAGRQANASTAWYDRSGPSGVDRGRGAAAGPSGQPFMNTTNTGVKSIRGEKNPAVARLGTPETQDAIYRLMKQQGQVGPDGRIVAIPGVRPDVVAKINADPDLLPHAVQAFRTGTWGKPLAPAASAATPDSVARVKALLARHYGFDRGEAPLNAQELEAVRGFPGIPGEQWLAGARDAGQMPHDAAQFLKKDPASILGAGGPAAESPYITADRLRGTGPSSVVGVGARVAEGLSPDASVSRRRFVGSLSGDDLRINPKPITPGGKAVRVGGGIAGNLAAFGLGALLNGPGPDEAQLRQNAEYQTQMDASPRAQQLYREMQQRSQ